LPRLRIINFNDVDGDGYSEDQNSDQPVLNNEFRLIGTDNTITKYTDANGHIDFGDILPGSFILNNTLWENWRFTKISCENLNSNKSIIKRNIDIGPITSMSDIGRQKTVNLEIKQGGDYVCSFAQQFSMLLINKVNNAPANNFQGDKIKFSITLSLPNQFPNPTDNILYFTTGLKNVILTDILPDGFDYTEFLPNAKEGVSNSLVNKTGVWKIGSMNPGDVVEVSYIATINNSVDPGLYKDLAWASGRIEPVVFEEIYNLSGHGYRTLAIDGEDEVVYAIDYINRSGNFAGTLVNVIALAFIPAQTVVLGTSTVLLPRTGLEDFSFIFIAFGFVLTGAIITLGAVLSEKLRKFNFKNNNKLNKGRFARSLLLLGMLTGIGFIMGIVGVVPGFIKPVKALAQNKNLTIKLEQPGTIADKSNPESPYQTNKSSFGISFVALDLNNSGSEVPTVACFKKGPLDIGFTNFLNTSGNTGNCRVDNGLITVDGSYSFFAVATFSGGSSTSNIVTVKVDRLSPMTPVDYIKTRVGCMNQIGFKTSSDGGKTVGVDIFRSELTTFTTTESNRMKSDPPGGQYSLAIGSNQSGSYIDNTLEDCSKNYYYVIQSVDVLGNRSSFIGDKEVVIVTYPVSSTQNGNTGADTNSNGTGNGSGNGNGTSSNKSGNVSPSPKVQGDTSINTGDGSGSDVKTDNNGSNAGAINNNLLIVFIAVVVVILGSLIIDFRGKTQKPTNE
jgi:hypothetical protein